MIEIIKKTVTLYVILPLVALLGLHLTIKLQFLQFTKLISACKHTFQANKARSSLSSLGALSAVLGGNLGTGNIAGIAVALTTGGPGALLWMVVMILLGTIIKFTDCYLGVCYRQKIAGKLVGGPMLYLSKGLNSQLLAKLFCIATVLSAVTVGNFVQVNSIGLPLIEANISPLWVAMAMALLVALVMIGGIRLFSSMVISIVPFMAMLYVVACLVILYNHSHLISASVKLIWHSAFQPTAISGGAIGYGLWEAVRAGFERGIFATDAGVGIAPILHAKVTSKEPLPQIAMQQGLISMLAPLVVMLICILTGLVLLVTGVWNSDLESTNVCMQAFKIGLANEHSGTIVILTLCLFAFTTILTWGYCAEEALHYLCAGKFINLFRWLFVLIIPLGVLFKVSVIWNIADLCLSAMLLINMIGVISLSPKVIKAIRNTRCRVDNIAAAV